MQNRRLLLQKCCWLSSLWRAHPWRRQTNLRQTNLTRGVSFLDMSTAGLTRGHKAKRRLAACTLYTGFGFTRTQLQTLRFYTTPAGKGCHGYLLAVGGVLGFFMRGKGEEEDEEEKVPPSVKRQLLLAQRALRERDFPGAEAAYHRALQLLGGSEHAESRAYIEARAVTLDKLANMYLERERFNEAEANFKETLRMMFAAGVDQKDNAVIEISLKLAKIYTNQRKYELAAAGFHWSVLSAKEKWSESETDESKALWGMCLQGKAQYHLVVGEYTKAAEAYSEALKLAEEVFGEEHLQVAVLHNDIATALDRLDQGSEAEGHVRQSLDIAASLEADENVAESLVTFQYNLGLILLHQGKTSEAAESYGKAIDLAKKLKDKTLHEQLKNVQQ